MRISLLIAIALIGLTDDAKPQSKEAIDCLQETPKNRYSDQIMAEQKIRAERARIEKQRLGFDEDPDHTSSSHVKPKLSKPSAIAYPRCASLFGLSGDCTVYFDVTAAGNAKDIFAFCSDLIFQDSAEEMVGEMIFDPATIDGVPVDYPGVVIAIPYEFSMNSIQQSD